MGMVLDNVSLSVSLPLGGSQPSKPSFSLSFGAARDRRTGDNAWIVPEDGHHAVSTLGLSMLGTVGTGMLVRALQPDKKAFNLRDVGGLLFDGGGHGGGSLAGWCDRLVHRGVRLGSGLGLVRWALSLGFGIRLIGRRGLAICGRVGGRSVLTGVQGRVNVLHDNGEKILVGFALECPGLSGVVLHLAGRFEDACCLAGEQTRRRSAAGLVSPGSDRLWCADERAGSAPDLPGLVRRIAANSDIAPVTAGQRSGLPLRKWKPGQPEAA